MSVICSGCGENITNVCLNAFGMTWHPTCICCNVCGKDFNDGSRLHEGDDGYAYCAKDYQDSFSVKCASCHGSIVGPCLEALGKKWHPDHFMCTTCKVVLSGQYFSTDDGLPYCERHYYEAMGLICAECEKPIVSLKCVPFGQKKYHPEHFKCTYCKTSLVGQPVQKQNEKPYCKKCHISLFG
eukprot:TRINITY_DN1084_c0_g1_i1.p1 TRINITY_DN1084_c0_g1~~TRINITY_DN1084_c0_g1_i1.p1  ORF type:complete len:183 (+),score=5.76 TRINITY_DN1084_c0_g1_i1:107-655(+)